MPQSNLDSNNASAESIDDKNLSVEDSITFLGEESEDEVIELDDKKKVAAKSDDSDGEPDDDKTDESDDEDKSVEDELEEELDEELKDPDDELELVSPVRRKEILAKYPDLFKDFPYLQKAYYREQKFAELLPTIEDARTAVERSQILDKFEGEILQGSTQSLLTTVRDNDREAFNRIVDNYLPTLKAVDENAFLHVAGNVIKEAVVALVQSGKEDNNDDLLQAAEVLHKYIFGTSKFTPPTRLSKTQPDSDKSKSDEVGERERQFMEKQLEIAQSSITTKVDNILKSTVDKNIDPNNSMTDYVRRTASREVMEALEKTIDSDKRFTAIKDRLWERAAKDNFSSESMDRIKSAYLSKAKTLLPDLIRKSRSEALKGLSRKANNSDDTKDKKGPLPVGKTRSTASSSNSGKTDNRSNKSIPRGMTSYDYLMSD